MNDPQNEPRICPYCDQPRQDTFENRFRFECGTSLRADDHKTVKRSDACRLRVELREARADCARLQHESTAHRVAWQNAEARERELREALDWLEEECPSIYHDAWTHSVDMAGNRWTMHVRINGPRERFRGKTLIETIQKARAACAQNKEAQP